MYKEKLPLTDYVKNLLLMNLAMGEMIHQLEELVIEDERNDKNDG
jgi:hypothetical protein